MGKTKNDVPSANSQKYGVPLYGASWVPSAAGSEDSSSSADYLIFSGGGGEGRSGIPNALLLSHFDFDSNSLSHQPVVKLGTGADLPYRMAVHPGGKGVIASLPKSCGWFEWDAVEGDQVHKLGLKKSEKVLTQLEDVGQQLALAFNSEGSILAVGGEDGNLRVFKWPSMEVILHEAQAHTSVKGLDFSPDGKFLISLGSGGPCRVWDVTSGKIVAPLPKENDEVFGFCKFSQNSDKNQVLYISTMRDQGGSIVTWNTTTWKRIGSKRISRDPVSAFSVSTDGKLLALGTIQGDIFIVDATGFRVHTVVKKAHLGLVTALMFSQDSRALVSASLDSSARVTLIKDHKQNGSNLWLVILVLLFAVAVYYMKTQGIISY